MHYSVPFRYSRTRHPSRVTEPTRPVRQGEAEPVVSLFFFFVGATSPLAVLPDTGVRGEEGGASIAQAAREERKYTRACPRSRIWGARLVVPPISTLKVSQWGRQSFWLQLFRIE